MKQQNELRQSRPIPMRIYQFPPISRTENSATCNHCKGSIKLNLPISPRERQTIDVFCHMHHWCIRNLREYEHEM